MILMCDMCNLNVVNINNNSLSVIRNLGNIYEIEITIARDT
jgi:hypothetical protein